MFEKFRPLGDRVLVRRTQEQERTLGGLYIPDSAKEKPQMGKVVRAGEGERISATGAIVPLPVKEGDTIYFSKYAGTELSSDFLVVRKDEILGVLE
ncbi:co-chaperone GroES [Vermiphilus pyriformis]|jgi:chaperonin GroES|uniref:Co-chaperonin GroES n=1 Tax=candidate division TM6 bacterium JCVI TM6SC1 TaxID=1306947 RepID=A0A0D2I1V7_9BACT|nr:molecular chaperone GroES [candidate division TM6 bacterium JCVI TM6SC1]UNE35208.1 MAG: co-chaperone GroES [Vermiphilus pyriformis]